MNNHIILAVLAVVGVLLSMRAGVGESFNPASGHVNQALTNLVMKHPTAQNFIADQICNVVPVNHESDFYWFLDNPALLDHSNRTLKGPGGESSKIELNWHQDSYRCDEHALHDDLPHRTRDNADNQLQLETEHVAAVRDGVQQAKEIRAAATLFSATFMTNNADTAARWDDATPANIKIWNDVLDAQYKVAKFGGAQATHVAMGLTTWKNVAKYLMAQAGTSGGVRWGGLSELLKENPYAMPTEFCGMKLLVGTAMKSTADRPANVSRAASGGNIDDIWSDNCLVFHKGAPGIKSIQLCSRFMKTGWPRVRQGTYSDTRASDWYEYAENESGVKVVAPSCGFLIKNTET